MGLLHCVGMGLLFVQSAAQAGNWSEDWLARISRGDCKGIASKDRSWCDTEDCRAIATGTYGLCETDDCRALVRGIRQECATELCAGWAAKDRGWCGSNADCKGVASGDKNWCVSDACRAITTGDVTWCRSCRTGNCPMRPKGAVPRARRSRTTKHNPARPASPEARSIGQP